MLALIAVPLAVLFYFVVSFTQNYFRLPRSFKGPFLASISEWWLAFHGISAGLHQVSIDLLKKHASKSGSVNAVRIGPKLLITDDPGLLRHMSATKSRWTRSAWHEAMSFNGFSTSMPSFAERDETKHRILRAKLAPGYSGKGVEGLEATIDGQISSLVRLLTNEYARKKKALDMTRISSWFTMDVLSEIAFGKCVGYLNANEDIWGFVEGSEAFFPLIQLSTNHTAFRRCLENKYVERLFAPKQTDEKGFGRLQRFARECIEERFKTGEHIQDMLGSFISHGLNQEQCKSESLIQIIAGSDSTASVIRITMLYIISNPQIYNTLRREVDGAAIAPDHIISDTAARKLPYLQAVIWEGLRKTPPLFGLVSKVAPPEGETFRDVYFPGNCEVAVCMQSLTHRQDIYGDDVHIFRPERWLEVDKDTRAQLEKTTELVFGSGRFSCLGRSIAFIELGKVFFELMRRFDRQVVDPWQPIKKSRAHGIWVQKGMDMMVTERAMAEGFVTRYSGALATQGD